MSFLFFLAQDAPAITGGAGWVGAGLLGTVLFWLLVIRMPAWDKLMDNKDKQIQGLIETRDKLFREIAEAHHVRMQAMAQDHNNSFAIAETERRKDFQASLQRIVDHCQRETDLMRGMVEKEIAESSNAMIDLRRTMEELREKIFGAPQANRWLDKDKDESHGK